jgi:hypothetical protein
VNTVDAATQLLEAITSLVDAGDTCDVDVYQVTAGEPADPTGENCTVITVWASQYFNSTASMFHEDNPCVIIRGVQLNYRIATCYPINEDGQDLTAAQHLDTATCLYGMADVIWCGLVQLIGENGLFDLRCADIQIDPLTVNPPSGGIVSANSGLRFQIGCEPTAVPEDIVGVIAGQEEGGEFG